MSQVSYAGVIAPEMLEWVSRTLECCCTTTGYTVAMKQDADGDHLGPEPSRRALAAVVLRRFRDNWPTSVAIIGDYNRLSWIRRRGTDTIRTLQALIAIDFAANYFA